MGVASQASDLNRRKNGITLFDCPVITPGMPALVTVQALS
jgi:hypothetical protein